ncbi:hypothetical protein Q2T40_09135 [Winogradskyella maritima]|uniref:Uncharacterized protein n=1 Tax=Winogradskyella maritima TaxID=1517766 RepID=A0ABV8ADQ5_9FLAO|nr:hypothetical protein [Winogradskyella maritima]
MNKVAIFFNNLNRFFRNLLLDDVDKVHDRPLPYHRKFGSVEQKKAKLKAKREIEQIQQNRGIF